MKARFFHELTPRLARGFAAPPCVSDREKSWRSTPAPQARRPYSAATASPITLSEHGVGYHVMVDRKTISIMKACELVGVSRRTIYNWIASGKVEYIRTAGGSVRIFVDTLWRDPARAPHLTSKEA
ncbi:MAG: excisionase family DNA-binding protein [Acidobacteria bacterium]|nr:excisionase family DNA-binding protein [Acidobacteriota bacterium]